MFVGHVLHAILTNSANSSIKEYLNKIPYKEKTTFNKEMGIVIRSNDSLPAKTLAPIHEDYPQYSLQDMEQLGQPNMETKEIWSSSPSLNQGEATVFPGMPTMHNNRL